MKNRTAEPLLTDKEHELIDALGDCADLFGEIILDGEEQEGDTSEVGSKICTLQNMVLAQAAARAYPDKYRLMGNSCDE